MYFNNGKKPKKIYIMYKKEININNNIGVRT